VVVEGVWSGAVPACPSFDRNTSLALSSVPDENRWNQRKITRIAKIHHKNHVLSMKGITTFSSMDANMSAKPGATTVHRGLGLITATKWHGNQVSETIPCSRWEY
jgi:hypothetical protein